MTGGLFRLITAVLTILGSVTLLPAVAHAQPSGLSTPKFLKLTMDAVAPGTVTTDSDPVLTVSGTVTNIGDRVVDDVAVRIQRAAPVTSPSGLRSSLRLDQINYEVTGPFQDVAQRLSPGQRKQFSVSIALRDGTGIASLGLTEPGVYPLLLNVNGEPAYGSQARLDDARFLLPVLGLPPAGGEASGAAAVPVPAPVAPPVATTVIWPLADRPRMVAGNPGSAQGQPELLDDELAVSLGKGGRLEQLVAALESVVPAPGRDPGVAGAVCIAVDPDLVSTVQTMTRGYRVLASPSDPEGATREGTGAANAQAWLDRLRALAASMCTVALPFAQVDVSALAAIDDPGLSARALNAPADVVDAVLGTRSLRGVSLPDSGTLDVPAAELLRRHGFGTAVLAGSAVSGDGAPAAFDTALTSAPAMLEPGVVVGGEQAAPDLVRVPLPPMEGVEPVESDLLVSTFDIWSATALAAVGSNPPTPSFTPAMVRFDVTNDSRSARLQDALGAMSWTALNPAPDRPRSQLLMPPQQWGANREEGIALLKQIELLTRTQLAVPRAFTELLAQPSDPHPFALEYLPRAAQDAAPERFVAPIRDQGARVSELMRALVEVPEAELTPLAFLTPAREDMLRALSLSDRRADDNTLADLHAQRRIDQVTRELDTLFGSVSVLPPGGVYTLASEQSPLLLVARNELPVAIRVMFRIEAPTETKITDIGEQLLPPYGTRSFQIPTEVTDSRTLVIPIALTTPEGIALGESTSVSVRSNAYGQALAIITACAGILLLLLAGRRLVRRFRGQPDPADEGFDPETQRRASRLRRARSRLRQQ